MRSVLLFACVLCIVVSAVLGQQHDQIEQGEAHIKATMKSLGPIAHKDTPERRRIDVLQGKDYHEADYHHEIQATVDSEVDTTARGIIDNPIRQAAKAAAAAELKFTKTVTSGTQTLLAHNKQEAARKAANTRKPKAAAPAAPASLLELNKIKRRKLATHELHALNNGLDNISIQKIATLTAPKVEYYHAVQKVGDREADRAARGVIQSPERLAWLKRIADHKRFAKVVGSASVLLKEHNKWERHPAEAKTF